MVPGRPDQPESRFSGKGQFPCENGPSGSQKPDFVNEVLLLYRLDMVSSMDPLDIPL